MRKDLLSTPQGAFPPFSCKRYCSPLELRLHYDQRILLEIWLSFKSKVFTTTHEILVSGTSFSIMEFSTPWRSEPQRETGSQEPQIERVEALADELDRTGRKHAVKPLMRSRAEIFAFSQSLNRLDWSAPFMPDPGLLLVC